MRHVEGILCVPIPLPVNIRYRLDLAGGATMDTGCYTVSLVRFLAGAEPEVVSARARLARPGVDRWMQADLKFDDLPARYELEGIQALITFSFRP